MQVASNRCRDFLKSRRPLDSVTGLDDLDEHLNSSGTHCHARAACSTRRSTD